MREGRVRVYLPKPSADCLAQGFIIMYSIDEYASFEGVDELKEQVDSVCSRAETKVGVG